MIDCRRWSPPFLAALLLGAACASAPAPVEPLPPAAGSVVVAPLPAWSEAPLASAPPAASAAPAASAEPDEPPDDEPGHPLPPGFVHVPGKGEARCGSLRVDMMREPQGDIMQRVVRVRAADGSPFHEFHAQQYRLDPTDPQLFRGYLSVEFCGDLTGDGVPEIVLTDATMGAHCCYTHHVFSLTQPVKNLMTWEKGDMGTPLWPVRYRPAGAWQIEGRVVFSPALAKGDEGSLGLSYASMPVVPVVFSLVKNRYQMTSLSFPEAFRQSRAGLLARCATNPDECEGELIIWVDSLAIGDWPRLSAQPMFKEVLPILQRASGPTRRSLQSLGSEARPNRLK